MESGVGTVVEAHDRLDDRGQLRRHADRAGGGARGAAVGRDGAERRAERIAHLLGRAEEDDTPAGDTDLLHPQAVVAGEGLDLRQVRGIGAVCGRVVLTAGG
jgi:hypothetical protein